MCYFSSPTHVVKELSNLKGARFAVVRYERGTKYCVAWLGRYSDFGTEPEEWIIDSAWGTMAEMVHELNAFIERWNASYLRGHN